MDRDSFAVESGKSSGEKLEAAKKSEEELKTLRPYVEKLQSQLKELTEENSKTIDENNHTKERLADLQKQLEEGAGSEVAKKDEIIANYEARFEALEEQSQKAVQSVRQAEEKVARLEGALQKQQREMEEVRKENERLALDRAGDANAFTQERLQFRKAVTVSEKTIVHLTKAKQELEERIRKETAAAAAEKPCRVPSAEDEAQTDPFEDHTETMERQKALLLQKEEELHTANNYSSTLIVELKSMKERISQMQARSEEQEKTLRENAAALERAAEESRTLSEENTDLRRRRESAAAEIARLSQQAVRSKGKPQYDAGRHLSDAVLMPETRV